MTYMCVEIVEMTCSYVRACVCVCVCVWVNIFARTCCCVTQYIEEVQNLICAPMTCMRATWLICAIWLICATWLIRVTWLIYATCLNLGSFFLAFYLSLALSLSRSHALLLLRSLEFSRFIACAFWFSLYDPLSNHSTLSRWHPLSWPLPSPPTPGRRSSSRTWCNSWEEHADLALVLQCDWTWRSSWQEHADLACCVAACCSVLQCVAVCCSVLQCVAVCCVLFKCLFMKCGKWQEHFDVALVLQCLAACCSVLQRVASSSSVSSRTTPSSSDTSNAT